MAMLIAVAGVSQQSGVPSGGRQPTLVFGVSRGSTFVSTPSQPVFLETSPDVQRGGPWTARVDKSWVAVIPASGTTPSVVHVGVNAAGLPDLQRDEAIITFSGTGWTRTVRAVLVVAQGGPPFGSLDLPGDHAAFPAGALSFEGWALDDIGVAEVEVCRDAVPGAAIRAACSSGPGIRIGSAAPPYGSNRPDVEAMFPQLPRSGTASWVVPVDTSQWSRAELGTFRARVTVRDIDGHVSPLGARTITVNPTVSPSAATGTSERPIRLLAGAVSAAIAIHLLLLWCCRPRARVNVQPDALLASPRTPAEVVAVVGLSIVSFVLSTRAAAGLTYDELYTYAHFVKDGSLWHSATTVSMFNNHVAYSVLANLTTRLLGSSEFALRLPSAALGALCVIALWRLTRDFASPAASMTAAALLAVAPMHQEWSYMARGYAGLAMMSVVSSWSFFRVLQGTSSAGTVATHVVSSALAIYFNMYGVWVVAVQYVFGATAGALSLIDRQTFRRLWRSFMFVGVATAVLYAPIAVELLGLASARGRTPVQARFPAEVFSAMTGTSDAMSIALAGLVLVIGFLRVRDRPRLAAYLAALLVVPFVIAWLVVRPLDLYPRLFHFGTPMVCLLMAIAIWGSHPGRPPSAAARGLSLVMAGLTAVLVLGWIRTDFSLHRDGGYRTALKALSPDSGRGKTLLVGPDAEILRYYVSGAADVTDSVDEIDRAMRGSEPVRVVVHVPGWETPGQSRIRELLGARCPSDARDLVEVFRCGY